jgi:Na+-transporting NADH:ubiquinone oxidoreductase subunit NqrF
LQITVLGLASQKSTSYPITEADLELNLLQFLQKQEVPVASSCSGEGVCEKCMLSDGRLSCRLTMKDLVGAVVKFSYL